MTIRVSGRDRRALAAGTLLITAVAVVTRVLPALHEWEARLAASAEELETELRRADAGVHQLPILRDSLLARTDRFIRLAPELLGGKTPAAAAGTLASWMALAAERAGMGVSAVHVAVDTPATLRPFAVLTARTELVGDIRGLADLLATLESGRVLLAVRELTIDQADPAAPGDRPETLHVRLAAQAMAVAAPARREP